MEAAHPAQTTINISVPEDLNIHLYWSEKTRAKWEPECVLMQQNATYTTTNQGSHYLALEFGAQRSCFIA